MLVSTIKLIIERIISLTINGRIGISGVMLNHQLNTVNPSINNMVTVIANNNLNKENGNLLISFFLVLASVNSNRIPQIPVAITHRLE